MCPCSKLTTRQWQLLIFSEISYPKKSKIQNMNGFLFLDKQMAIQYGMFLSGLAGFAPDAGRWVTAMVAMVAMVATAVTSQGHPRFWGSGYFLCLKMGVSKNRGTPKSSILIGFSIINHPFWGTPIFGNTQMYANHVETLWIQVPPKKILYPPNCTLSAFLEATWIHREKSVGVYFFSSYFWIYPPKGCQWKVMVR